MAPLQIILKKPPANRLKLNTLSFSENFNVLKRKDLIKQSKNAYFVDFLQYNSLQDSLEIVFNKFYNSNLAKMVQDLKDK